MSTKLAALEAIAFQRNNPLGPSIEAVITSIRNDDPKEREVSKLVRKYKLGKVLSDSIGIDFILGGTDGYNAYVYPPDLEKNHPFNDYIGRVFSRSSDAKLLLKKRDIINGHVDLVKAKVSGDFKDLIINIHLGDKHFLKDSKLTVGESTAALLHEVGHVMTSLELLGRTLTTNYVLENAMQELLDTRDTERQYLLIDSIKEASDISLDSEVVKKATTKEAMTLVIINGAREASKSQLGFNIYDQRGWEQASDQFSTRMGYGRDLAVGLDKLLRYYGVMEFRGTFGAIFFNILDMVISNPVPRIIIMLLGITPSDRAYDKPLKRLEVIRADIIRSLRDKRNSKAEKAKILDDIAVIDKLIDNVNNFPLWTDWVWQNVVPWGIMETNKVKFQQILETISSGNLNVPAAELEQLV